MQAAGQVKNEVKVSLRPLDARLPCAAERAAFLNPINILPVFKPHYVTSQASSPVVHLCGNIHPVREHTTSEVCIYSLSQEGYPFREEHVRDALSDRMSSQITESGGYGSKLELVN